MKTKNFFYEKSNFKEFVSNITYDDLLKMNDSDFIEWAKNLRNGHILIIHHLQIYQQIF